MLSHLFSIAVHSIHPFQPELFCRDEGGGVSIIMEMFYEKSLEIILAGVCGIFFYPQRHGAKLAGHESGDFIGALAQHQFIRR